MNDLSARQTDTEPEQAVNDALASILATAPVPRQAPTDPHLLQRHQPSARPARVVIGAAAATVLVVGAGGLIALNRSNNAGTLRVSASTPADSTAAPDSTASSPSIPADPWATKTGYLLPRYLPSGYAITNLAAFRSPRAIGPDLGRWVRTDADGAGVAQFSVRAQPATTDPDRTIQPNTTVRGVPARAFDSGEGIVVTWTESQLTYSARGRNMSRQATLAAAEALIIGDGPTVDLPDGALAGFERLVTSPRANPDDIVATSMSVSRIDGSAGGFISVSSEPNTSGETLATLQTRGDDFTRQVVGGVDRLVSVRNFGGGPFTTVWWIEGELSISVSGRAPTDEVLAFAAGLTPATNTEFAARGTAITQTAATLDVLDSTTLADGLAVSVRSVTPASGAIAVCVDAPVQRCRFLWSETSLGGDYQAYVNTSFDIDGHVTLIAWQDANEAARLGEPTLRPSSIITDLSNPQPATTTATITQLLSTDHGRFIRIDVPAGEAPPQIEFTLANGMMAMSTPTPSPYDF